MKLEGQVAIVTGAGRNIGEDTCKLLAAEGAKIAVVDIDKGRGDRVATEIKRAGGEAIGVMANVSSETRSVHRLAKTSPKPTRLVINLRQRPGIPIEVARAAFFLAGDDSDFIVGDLLFVDGGAMVTMEGA